jgi:aminopeptidase N
MKRKTAATLGAFALGSAVAGAATRALLARRRRESSGKPRWNEYERYATWLRLSHDALRKNLDHAVELIDREQIVDRDRFGDFIRLLARFLTLHHDAEDHAIFPALRRSSILRSTDAAYLERWDVEHREIHRANAALEEALGDWPRLRHRCGELRQILEPHLAGEEAILNAQHLPEMIDEKELAAAVRSVRREKNAGPLMAAFLARSLSPGEREDVFGDAPWVFRRVILPQVTRLGMRRYEDFTLYRA